MKDLLALILTPPLTIGLFGIFLMSTSLKGEPLLIAITLLFAKLVGVALVVVVTLFCGPLLIISGLIDLLDSFLTRNLQ